MVSLRNNLPSLGYFALVAVRFGLLAGAGLLAMHLLGAAWHSAAHRASPSIDSLAGYADELRAGAPFDLNVATRRIYLGTTHSDDRRIAITENWLQWTLGCIYEPLSHTQDARRLIAGNLANCSERAQILKELAEISGHDCRFAGLTGHVVLEVKTPDGWRVADPDYGVVYPLPLAVLQQAENRPLVQQTLDRAGFPPQVVDHYLQIVHSAEDNIVLPVASPLSPRLHRIECACHWLAWLLPAGCLLLSCAVRPVLRRPALCKA